MVGFGGRGWTVTPSVGIRPSVCVPPASPYQPPCSRPLLESLGCSVSSVSPPLFLRPVFLLLRQAPAFAETGACVPSRTVFGVERGRSPEEAPRDPSPPPRGFQFCRRRGNPPFVDSLTEVMFYLPFPRSLCLAFGQTTNNAPHGNPSICGMCGLAGPVSGPRKTWFHPPRGPRPAPWSVALCPLGVGTGSRGHFSPEQCPHVLDWHTCQPIGRVPPSERLRATGGSWSAPLRLAPHRTGKLGRRDVP